MKRNYKKFSLWGAVILVTLLVVARLLLSPVTVSSINQWFSDRGVDSEIDDLSFDIYNGTVSLTGLRAKKGDISALALDEFSLGWSWSALFERQLKLESVLISGFQLELERKPDGRLLFAAIDFARQSQAEDQQSAAPSGEMPQWSIALQNLEINDYQVCYRDLPLHDYCNSFDKFDWSGPIVVDLSRLEQTAVPLLAEGDFRLAGLRMQNNRLRRRLFGFDDFTLQGVRIDDLDSIEIETISLDNLSMLEKTDDPENSDVTRLEKLEIDQFSLKQLNRLEIASARVLNQQGRLVKRDDDRLETSEWLEEYEKKAETDGENPAADEQPFSFAIDKLVYETERSLQYVDLSLSSTFVIDLNNIQLSIENLDSANTEQTSKIEYRANYAKHGKVSFSGTATPLDPTPTLDLKGTIKGMDLPELSAFTAKAIGHRIKSGQLDANIELKAVDSVLDSKIDLRLDHLKLAPVSEKDSEKIDNKLGFPLNTSLSLLKDRDDVIELSIPVTGDTNSPDFDPTDAISKAISVAITTAVINYYTPFGLVTLADGLFSLATALRFDPVVFEPGNGGIDSVDSGGLEKIAGLMQERPGVRVTLCAYTNSDDRRLLLPETVEIAADELELNDEQIAILERLGESRRDRVEDYLVGKSIDPARLVACETEHKEGSGLAGVEISI